MSRARKGKSGAQRVAGWRRRIAQAGGKVINIGLEPDAVEILDREIARTGETQAAVVNRAIRGLATATDQPGAQRRPDDAP